MFKVSKEKSIHLSTDLKKEPNGLKDCFEPVTEDDAKFIEKKYKEVKDSGYMSDEEFFSLLDEE